jgi:poly-gamma-glutamate capsule biosynthesis protein CapA/YwtB (metallophosphatase superfamily)
MIALVLPLVLSAAPAELSVLVSGDVTLGYHYEEYVDEQVKKGKPRDEMLAWGFQNVKALTTKADVFVVNLECPFTEHGEKIAKNFNFRARPELVAALLAGGVDVVSLANNHMVDYGPEGLFDTLNTLDTNGIAHFGAGRSLSEARTPAMIEKKGITIAFLGYFFLGDRNIEPPMVIAVGDQPGVAGHFSDTAALKEMLTADIAAAKKKADHVIPFFHWGRESKGLPEAYQMEVGRFAIDAGASAVLGSHPHVLQGIELYRGKPIVYSLGNFVFGGNWDPKDKKTALVELKVTKAAIKAVTVIPAQSDAFPEVPVQPFLLEGEKADAVLQHLAALSKGFPATIPQLKNIKPAPDVERPDAGL